MHLCITLVLCLQGQPEQQVPPTHWSYKEFHQLATEGVAHRYPAFDFLGGRVFTRGELAEVCGDIVRLLTEKPELATAARVEQVKKLIAEFEPEMKLAGHPRDLPEPAKPKPPAKPEPKGVRPFGSDVHTVAINKDHGDTYTRTVDMNVEADWFAAKIAGSMDTRDNDGVPRHTGDLFLGDRLSWQATERWIEGFGTVIWPGLSGKLRLGDSRNTTFASGLMLGASDVDGVRGTLKWKDWLDGIALVGHTDNEADLMAFRASGSFLGNALSVGVEAADIAARTDERSGTLFGVSGFYTDKFVDVWMEGVEDRDNGGAFFGRVIFYYHHNLQFQADVRNYRDMPIDENSAPIYAGISGGQDEDDRGWLLKSVWSPKPWLTFTGKIERAARMDNHERRLDFFGEGRARAWKGGELGLSYEFEDVDTGAENSLVNISLNQSLGEQWAGSLAYSRDDRDGQVIHTLRDTLRYTFLNGKATLELSHTYRKDEVDDEHIFQPRALYTLNANVFASVRGTFSTEPDRTDTSVEFTVVIRW